MQLSDLTPEAIRILADIGGHLYDVDVHIPPETDLQKDMRDINTILPPPGARSVTMEYTKKVRIAYDYVRTHRNGSQSMLNDIMAGKKISIADYKEEVHLNEEQ